MHLRVKRCAGQQAALQHTEHLHVQLPEERPVGHQADTRPRLLLLLFLFLRLLLWDTGSSHFRLKCRHIFFQDNYDGRLLTFTGWVLSPSVDSSSWLLLCVELLPAAFLFFPAPSERAEWEKLTQFDDDDDNQCDEMIFPLQYLS